VITNKLTKDDKLLLAFDALVLSEAIGHEVNLARIVHGDDHAMFHVKTSALMSEVRERIEHIAVLLSNLLPPDLVLNRHCAACDFQARCRQKAVEKDDLSLLANMTEKERKKCHSKGIFTATQLSFTFRPRRHRKRLSGRREKYHHSLKALAIRERKIYIVGSQELRIEGTPVYLDVEGLPDKDFYYLIGMRIRNGDAVVQYSLWAESADGEKRIWADFLDVLSTIENPVLIHYGSYETTFLKRMRERYGEPREGSRPAETTISAVNLLSLIFAQVYFPTFSNRLKDVAGHLGFQWSDITATGLQAIRWRHEWADSRSPSSKQELLRYNAEDCEAVEVVASKLVELQQATPQAEGSSVGGVVHTAQLKWQHPYGFKRNTFSFSELDVINKAAYWDYQRERVYVKTNSGLKRALGRTSRPKTDLSPNKTIECPPPRFCLKCGSGRFFGHGKKRKTVFDLKFMRHGVKRWITRYQFHRYKCQACGGTFVPEEPCRPHGKFGPEIMAYAVYQNVGLRLPQRGVDRSMNELFGLHLPRGTTSHFKAKAATAYEEAYNALVKRLCRGRLLHADETKVSVKGNNGFVWIFANLEEVAYVYSETREGDLVQTLLKDFTGVLVSDYYAAYDSIECPQQKCLIHLIRDINDDILQHPYDEELKRLGLAFAHLVTPMVETVDRHGLKSRFLMKHLVSVEHFYQQLSDIPLQSEAAIKLRGRFRKNRDTLFTFLNYDGVPWNNNNAEHAVKAFATLRRVIGGVTTERGIRDYLVLLSICETCKYQELNFLDFLRSGEKDVAAFAASREKGEAGRRTISKNQNART
jgi:predicted RecB family nuclease